jgi:hypothetical protein
MPRAAAWSTTVANQILTNSVLTREALPMFINANPFMRRVNREYSDQFARSGGKIGSTLNLRQSVDYTVRSGPTSTPQNTVESEIPLVIQYQKGVDLSFSSAERALNVDDFANRYLKRAVNNLAAIVASDIMSMIDGGTGAGPAQHLVHNVDASNNTIPPTMGTFLQAGAKLVENGYPDMDRLALLSPTTNARVVSSMSTLFNPVRDISEQTRSGMMGSDILGIAEFMQDVTVINHKTGSFTAGTVSGAGQTGTTLVTSAITGTLNAGDVITIAGVNSVNRLTKLSSGAPRQFVVTAAVASGATSIPIFPAITPYTVVGGVSSATQYQTVDVSPAAGAVISLVTNANETYRNNIVFAPEALTLATVDLPLMGAGVVDEARENYQGISMRLISYYNGTSDQLSHRLDILYGYAVVRPEWIVRVPDAI